MSLFRSVYHWLKSQSDLSHNGTHHVLLFPVTTKYQYKIRECEEGTPEKASAGKMFGMLHGVSVLVNLGSILANTAYLLIQIPLIVALHIFICIT